MIAKSGRHSFSFGLVVSLVLSCILDAQVFGQSEFVAIPPEQVKRYHFDFQRNLFPSPAAEKAERANYDLILKELERLKGHVADDAGNLLHALELNNRVQILFYRHYTYLYLRNAVDTTDQTSLAESDALESEVEERTAFLRQELLGISDRALTRLIARKPALNKYRFAIDTVRRYRPYTLSLKEEELLSSIAPNNSWPYDLYERLRADTPTVPAPQSTTEAKDREALFKQKYANRAGQRELYAFALMKLASLRTRLADVRHFPDAASEVYFNSYLTKTEVDDLVKQIAQKADLYKRYERIRADHVKQFSGLTDVNVWDLSLRPKNLRVPRFNIEQGTEIIRNALAPFGPDYGRELAALLDPANGRMDIVPGPHRKRGGFSKGFIGTDSVFFSGGFTGSYNDLRVLTHESTHAVHRQLMTSHQVLPAYAEGPHYLFEAFAIFSELLLPDYLFDHESDPLLKQFYLEQFLDGKGTIMFVVAPEVATEHAVYESVKRGAVKSADDLDRLTKQIYARYSIWAGKHDELKAKWMDIGLMYEDPFYDVNYIYGALLALKFYELFKRDPQHFISNYTALMRNGFDAPPDVLLRRFLNIDLRDPRLLSDALSVIQGKIDLLETSYHLAS
jgi:oligoendopeptidase F